MTEKLYYQDGYQRAFTSTVRSCEKKETTYLVVLETTLFYPEGGGQPADWGSLDEARVLDVQERDGKIYHETDRPLAIGQEIRGVIDWERRFDLMQNHSGEHILSGVICSEYQCQNVGFHMGKERILIDFDTRIPKEDLAGLEERANEAIWRNMAVQVAYPPKDVLEGLAYRSKIEIEGQVRIVEVEGYDCCACCGLHVDRAGEIGIIQITAHQSYKGGTRLEILCGKRALTQIRKKNLAADAVGRLLSVPGDGILSSVEGLLEEREQLGLRVNRLKGRIYQEKAEQLAQQGQDVAYYGTALTGKDAIHFADGLVKRTGKRVFVFSPVEEGFAYVLVSGAKDAKELFGKLQERFSCKGGGKADAVQGRIAGEKDEILAFWREMDFYCEGEE